MFYYVFLISLELPWDRPSADCEEYIAWKKGDYMNRTPWFKLDTVPLSLIKIILNHLPSARPTPQQIAEHRWLKTPLKQSSKLPGLCWLHGFLTFLKFLILDKLHDFLLIYKVCYSIRYKYMKLENYILCFIYF